MRRRRTSNRCSANPGSFPIGTRGRRAAFGCSSRTTMARPSCSPPPKPSASRRLRSNAGRRSRTPTGCGRRSRSSRRPGSATACGSFPHGTSHPIPRRSSSASTRVSHSAPAPIRRPASACAGSTPTCARGRRVLDYGCGSGILAIAAAKLGASRVVGSDIDPQALQAARANSEANAVRADYTEPDSLRAGTWDVVLANILSNPLMLLAPALLARVAPGGALVLSGVLERQADQVIEAYRAADASVPLSVWAADEGWVCLAGHRPH